MPCSGALVSDSHLNNQGAKGPLEVRSSGRPAGPTLERRAPRITPTIWVLRSTFYGAHEDGSPLSPLHASPGPSIIVDRPDRDSRTERNDR